MDPSFFSLSKWLWLLFSPTHLLLWALLAAWLLLLAGRRRRGLQLLTLLLGFLMLLTWLPIGDGLLYPLESRFSAPSRLPERVDGILVLGGSVQAELGGYWKEVELNEAAERLTRFIELARQYPQAQLIFTGGSASLRPGLPTEAEQVRPLFERAGIGDRVRYEHRARNTQENALFSRQLARPQPGEHWLLITTAFHMPRAVGVFCRQGWALQPIPVDHRSMPEQLLRPRPDLLAHLNNLQVALHEWLGLIAYRLSGKTSALLPRGCGNAS